MSLYLVLISLCSVLMSLYAVLSSLYSVFIPLYLVLLRYIGCFFYYIHCWFYYIRCFLPYIRFKLCLAFSSLLPVLTPLLRCCLPFIQCKDHFGTFLIPCSVITSLYSVLTSLLIFGAFFDMIVTNLRKGPYNLEVVWGKLKFSTFPLFIQKWRTNQSLYMVNNITWAI